MSASSRFVERKRLRDAAVPARRVAVAEAMKTVEYVPDTMPTSIVNANPRSASPPKT